MYPQKLLAGRIKDQFQSSRRIPANLPARNLAKVRDPHFVGNALIRQLLLGFPNEGNLRNRINAVGIIFALRVDRHPKRFRCCSIDTDPKLGNPITSPTAKICGCVVRYSSSTLILPRPSASSPPAARFSSSTFPCRPTAYSSASPDTFFLLFKLATTSFSGVSSTLSTSSFSRSVTRRSRK